MVQVCSYCSRSVSVYDGFFLNHPSDSRFSQTMCLGSGSRCSQFSDCCG